MPDEQQHQPRPADQPEPRKPTREEAIRAAAQVLVAARADRMRGR